MRCFKATGIGQDARRYDKKKRQPVLALENACACDLMRVKDPKPAAWNHGRHIATAKPKICVCGKHRVFEQIRTIIVRINRVYRKFIRHNRVVRWKRSSHYLVNPNSRTC